MNQLERDQLEVAHDAYDAARFASLTEIAAAIRGSSK